MFWLLMVCVAALGCRTAAPSPMTFAEAGFVPPPAPKPVPARAPSLLERRTLLLLDAIERATGHRPALDDEELAQREGRAARRKAKGWAGQRAALATEILRATDRGEATVRALKRARSALRFDLLVGAPLASVDRELVQTALARVDALLPPPVPVLPTLTWPVDPVYVTSPFGVRLDPLGEGTRLHTGIDLAALTGQIVRTAAPGKVLFAGRRGGYGLHVDVEHADGLVTRYAHLSELEVSRDELVGPGAVLGRAGMTGRATGPHLHFELWRDGLPVDPELELEPVEPPARSARR